MFQIGPGPWTAHRERLAYRVRDEAGLPIVQIGERIPQNGAVRPAAICAAIASLPYLLALVRALAAADPARVGGGFMPLAREFLANMEADADRLEQSR